jgi:shikimate kinase
VIALVGMPGSGKTTVARMLAKRLGVSQVDSDQEIEREIGCSIREFFADRGEDAFRDVEVAVIDRLTQAPRQHEILATGGGVVLRSENRDILRERCHVIYLRAWPEDIFRRLRHDRARPLLQVRDPLQRLRDLFAVRDPLYKDVAHFVMETGRPSVATLVNMILMQLDMAGLSPSPTAHDSTSSL